MYTSTEADFANSPLAYKVWYTVSFISDVAAFQRLYPLPHRCQVRVLGMAGPRHRSSVLRPLLRQFIHNDQRCRAEIPEEKSQEKAGMIEPLWSLCNPIRADIPAITSTFCIEILVKCSVHDVN